MNEYSMRLLVKHTPFPTPKREEQCKIQSDVCEKVLKGTEARDRRKYVIRYLKCKSRMVYTCATSTWCKPERHRKVQGSTTLQLFRALPSNRYTEKVYVGQTQATCREHKVTRQRTDYMGFEFLKVAKTYMSSSGI